ncbi:MAG: hypothetical protein LQ349_007834 [Xanthoria aureola]|nr:MAG: hypothetical protein LQ349_007834 [Xanthoria aureola]
MAEVFATFAGVASLIDVALRACNVLYDSCRYLRDAPQLSQRLRRTIQSVESVLRSVNESGATYRQQQTSAGLPDFLPSAVNDEIKSIKAELDALSTLLPSSSSSGQLRSKSKFVLDRKKVTEVTQALDSHQITLILSLQTFAQRNGIELQNDLVRRLEHIHRQGEDSAKNLRENTQTLRDELVSGNASLHADINTLHDDVNTLTQTSQASLPAQESIKSNLAALHDTMSTGQDTVIQGLNTVSQMLQSNTILTASTERLPRLVRAELRRVIIPDVQQCFNTYKGSHDSQLAEILKKIDEMANQLASIAGGNQQHDVEPCHGSLPETTIAPTHMPQDSIDLATPLSPATAVLGRSNSNYQNRPRSLHHQKWSCSWTFHWRIGKLRVTISTTVTKRRESPDYRVGGFVSPPKSYQVTVQFTPVQSLIQLRGLELSIANRQDQRGYYQICPLLSTFAVVPDDAEVFRYVRENNIDGIQDLFQRRLAAPSDRDEYGRTLLMCAALHGHVDLCRLLLDEGSDHLARTVLDTLEDAVPAIVTWIHDIVTLASPLPLGCMRSTLQILLSLGADINARWLGCPPVIYLFSKHKRIDTDDEESNTTIVTEFLIALLEKGADPLALLDNGASIFDAAEGSGLTSELALALQKTGYDLDEVRQKIHLAQWSFRNPGHSLAESTAIDRSQSTAGVVSRRAVAGDRLEE